MPSLEELMGMFGGGDAGGAQGLGPAAEEDPRRRKAGLGSGYSGIAGGDVSMAQLLPHLQGLRSYDYSGPFRGLADMARGGGRGPAMSHFQRQGQEFQDFRPPGFDQGAKMEGFTPPGWDNQNPVGGPNVAPGDLGTGQAGYQPGLQGLVQSQGWRNVAPGYSAAAGMGYGTQEFADRMSGRFGAGPAGGSVPPGQMGGETGGGGGAARGGPGGAGGAPAGPGAGAAPAARPEATAVQQAGGGGGGGRPAPAAPQRSGGPGGRIQDNKGGAGSPGGGGKKTIAARNTSGPPRTTANKNLPGGTKKTVSKGGGEGKYVGLEFGPNMTEAEKLAQIRNQSRIKPDKKGSSLATPRQGRPGQPTPPPPKPKPAPEPVSVETRETTAPAPKGKTKPKPKPVTYKKPT